MSHKNPIRVTDLRGYVTQDIYAKGTKSERMTLFIKTNSGKFLLRRKRGPAFGNSELTHYIGHIVECEGFLIGNTLLAERIEIVE